jgi:hypothetical protein
MFVISATFFALDPSTMTILPPMSEPIACPCDESTWHAVSESEWKAARRLEHQSNSLDLWNLAKALHHGQLPENCGRISAFTLLALISGQLCSICSRERLTLDIYDSSDSSYVARTERILASWERLWRRHPRAEQSLTRLDDPLLNDCLSMLCSAYSHLYVGSELVILKRIAEHPARGLDLPKHKHGNQALKVIKYLANSWLVRAKIGVKYLSKSRGLEHGPQALSAIYESGKSAIRRLRAWADCETSKALILAWWLHIDQGAIFSSPGQVHSGDEEKALASSVRRIFREIMDELDEQDTSSCSSGPRSLDPLAFYSSICRDWVWKCSGIVESRLQGFASFLDKTA